MFVMFGKENSYSQITSPSVQNGKKAKKTNNDTPSVTNNSAKRIRNLIASIKVSPSIASSKDNPTKVAQNFQKIKRQNTLPLREIKHIDELNNRSNVSQSIEQEAKPTKSQPQASIRLSYCRHNPEEAYQSKIDVPLTRYMVKPGYGPKNSGKSNKAKHFTLNLTEIESLKRKVTPKRLFPTDETGDENISDEYQSTIEDDDDTSINSVPTFSQPNTSRSRHYLHPEMEKHTASFHFDENSFYLQQKRDKRFINENFRYSPIKCSLTELEKALLPDVNFDDVFTKRNDKKLLANLLSFLGIKDSFALMRTSKALYSERKVFMKHLTIFKYTQGLSNRQRKYYWMSVTKAKVLKELYGEPYYPSLLIKQCSAEMEIRKDIDRTFQYVKQFKTKNCQDALFRILKALAVHYPDIGYCQGMNFVAAMMLLVESEIDAFYLMMALIKNYKFKGIYGENLRGTIEMCKVFDWLLSVYHPDLFEYMESIDITSLHFFTQWCTGLFSCELEKEIVFKIWDIFFQDKWKFIFRLGLAIIKELKEKLFKMPPENVVSFLRHFSKDPTFDIKKALKEVPNIKLSNRLLNELWQNVSTEREIRKVSLFFDPKIGKKTWRIEYQETSIMSETPSMIKEQNDGSNTSRSKSNPGFLISLFEKIKQRLTLDSSMNADSDKKSARDTTKTSGSDGKQELSDELYINDENITAATPTNKSIPNILKAQNNFWKKNEDEFGRTIPLTDRPLQKK